MSYVDIILIALAVGAAVIGYRKGAIRQAASIGGLIVALFAVRVAGDRATAIVAGILGENADAAGEYTARIIGCGLLFLAVWGGCWMLGRMLRLTVRAVMLGPVDGVAGSVFLIFKWGLVVSLLLNLWKIISPDSSLFSASRLAGGRLFAAVMDLAPAVMGFLRDSFVA